MKRIIAFVLAVLTVAVVIAGCTTNKDNNTTNNTTTEAKSTTTGKQTTTQTTTEKKDPVTPTVKKAFEGEIGDVLDKIVEKAKEIDTSEYGIGSIACHHREITADIAIDILGIDDKEFAKLIDAAIESQPDGYGTHIPS